MNNSTKAGFCVHPGPSDATGFGWYLYNNPVDFGLIAKFDCKDTALAVCAVLNASDNDAIGFISSGETLKKIRVNSGYIVAMVLVIVSGFLAMEFSSNPKDKQATQEELERNVAWVAQNRAEYRREGAEERRKEMQDRARVESQQEEAWNVMDESLGLQVESQGELINPEYPWRRGQKVEILETHEGFGAGKSGIVVGQNQGNMMFIVDYGDEKLGQVGWHAEVESQKLKASDVQSDTIEKTE
jgi:hypothetical protein